MQNAITSDIVSLPVAARLLGKTLEALRAAARRRTLTVPIVAISTRHRGIRKADLERVLGRALNAAELTI
ncbi:hypothetical protein GCM10027046_23840 [Uliginosibacterium flavum]|uniref:Uncharacterized protein n=1 Tax=Uliginosibacterium flavum TaxID=1396831 RepID=A0ABV2TK61_9RHOO